MRKIVFTEEEIKIIEKAKEIFSSKWDEAHTGTEEYRLLKNAFFSTDEIVTEINSDGTLDI